MKLLSRSKSKRHPVPATRDGAVSQQDEQLPVFQKRQRQFLRKDSAGARPQTADGVGQSARRTRMSIFEPFEIQAGDDVFSFPKPQSARTIPAEIAAMAAAPNTGELSPMIGVAFGSPSHPPKGWQDFQRPGEPASSTRLDFVQHAYNDDMKDVVTVLRDTSKKGSGWKKFGGLFRRPTRTKRPAHAYQLDPGIPALPRRSNTEPLRSLTTRKDSEGEGQPYQQRNARSTAKMQSILGVDTLRDLDKPLQTLSLASPPAAHSRPFRRRDRPLPEPPKADHVTATHQTSISTSTFSSSLDGPPPRLELSLPSAELDRYSVMFETVLETKPSIFERRRSRLQVMTITDGETTKASPPRKPLPLAKETDLQVRALTMSRDNQPDAASERRGSSPVISPAIDMWMNSPLAPSPLPKDTPPEQSPRSPKLERPNMSPSRRPSPLKTNVDSPHRREANQSRLTFFDSPSSDDDDEDQFSPETPKNGSPEYLKIKVFSDTASHHTTATSTIVEPKEPAWHAVLPAPPEPTASPRLSLDVERSPGSDGPMRSKSHNDTARGRARQGGRQPQVAVARSISVSRLQKASVRTGSATSLRPKVIQVGALAHSRRSSVLEYDHDTLDSTRYGVAL